MIAPVDIPESFDQWNRRWSAPDGRVVRWPGWLQHTQLELRRKGPFAWQPNNKTRSFEFPWAYSEVIKQGRNLNVVEIGGGLSGLQFVLASEGHHVTNVDPGVNPGKADLGWAIDRARHERLCQAFRAPVRLLETTIREAGIPDSSVDVLICVSALEHFTDSAVAEFEQHVARVLKPDGLAVLTVDLFLDISPFASRLSNEFGRNLDVCRLLRNTSLELVSGRPHELLGFPEFDPQAVIASLSHYLRGEHPVVSQCLTAKRATSRSK